MTLLARLRYAFYVMTEYAAEDSPRLSMESAVIGVLYSVTACGRAHCSSADSWSDLGLVTNPSAHLDLRDPAMRAAPSEIDVLAETAQPSPPWRGRQVQ